jgi:hypothetical protein
MFLAMFGVMIARPDEYSHPHGRTHDETTTAADQPADRPD